jgi:CheY-like chemotaxis protein
MVDKQGSVNYMRNNQKGIVLVVDDEAAFCAVICEILEANGYEPHYTLTAAEALQVLEHLHPDIILSDVMMPDMDGLSFVSHLRAHPKWAHIPIIVISAKTSTEDRRLALEAGANQFLAKPFSANDLENLIEATIKANQQI